MSKRTMAISIDILNDLIFGEERDINGPQIKQVGPQGWENPRQIVVFTVEVPELQPARSLCRATPVFETQHDTFGNRLQFLVGWDDEAERSS